MKLRNVLLIIGSMLATLGKAGEIATFDKANHGISVSLWHDRIGFESNEKAQMQMTSTEKLDYSAETTTPNERLLVVGWTIAFVLTGILLFLICKWTYLALSLTEYEKFTMDMREHYYRHLVDEDYFPYHDCKASKFLFNFRVWNVKQALDRTLDNFSHMDYICWTENNEWRPKIHYIYWIEKNE